MRSEEWEKLFRTGEVKRFSEEYFSRYRGTEFFVHQVRLGRETWVIGWVKYNSNECPSTSKVGCFASRTKDVLTRLEKAGGEAKIADVMEGIPEEKYRDMYQGGESLPTCSHCGRIWE